MKKIRVTEVSMETGQESVKEFTVATKAKGGFYMVYEDSSSDLVLQLAREGNAYAALLWVYIASKSAIGTNEFPTTVASLADTIQCAPITIRKALARLQDVQAIAIRTEKGKLITVLLNPNIIWKGSPDKAKLVRQKWQETLDRAYIVPRFL